MMKIGTRVALVRTITCTSKLYGGPKGSITNQFVKLKIQIGLRQHKSVDVFTKMFCHNCGSEVLQEYLYCSQRGIKIDIAVPSFRLLLFSENVTKKEAIEAYFNSGFSYNALFCFLGKYHGISMSLSMLKRRLSKQSQKKQNRRRVVWRQEIDTKRAGWPRQHFWLQRDVAYIVDDVWLVYSRVRGGIPFKKVRSS